MSDPVGLVTVHHEGAGTPSDNVQRFADGGYTYAIGATKWVRFRSVAQSYATLRFNHRSLDICLSGNRMLYEVTGSDIALIRGAYMDAYVRGEVDSFPEVVAHKNSPGSSTVCPGDKTMQKWAQIEAACRPNPVPTPEPPKPQPSEAPLTCVALEQTNPNGRTPTARPDTINGVVLLENGATVKDDKPGPSAGPELRRTWRHPKVQHDARLVDVCAPRDLDPPGTAFVALYRQNDGRIVTFAATLAG